MSLSSLTKWLPVHELFHLIYAESERPKLRLGILALVSGGSNALLLALINNASHKSVDDSVNVEISTFFIFSFTLVLFAYSKRYTLTQGATMVEEIMRKLRVRIITKLSQTDLRFIETSGRGYIFNRLTQDTALISGTALLLFASMESAVMLFGALVYLVWLDLTGALMTILATSLGGMYYLKKRKQIMVNFENSTERENEFVDYFLQQIDAFKELKINRKKALALLEIQIEKARAVELEKVTAGRSTTTIIVFSQVWFYILLGVIIFVLPSLGNTPVDNVVKLTTAILFIIGPIEMLIGSLPNYMKTNVAISRLNELEEMINKAIPSEQADSTITPPEAFKEIQFSNVYFSYRKSPDIQASASVAKVEKRKRRRLYDPNATQQEEAGFGIGPLSFTIAAGEIIFLIGGNGCGKTTLLKLLTGLYRPHTGTVRAFGDVVDAGNYQTYRELYTTIFSDFFLFKELFGMGQIDNQQLTKWLAVMELSGLTALENNCWTNTELSTGQRKRLAYVNSLIDNKQIYVFDELASDQDPEFREFLYRELLPDLRNDGKTIFAATHDDRYFDTADRLLKFDKDLGLIEIPVPGR
jgi:putative pyoverdin transport system ATP-binding/permease protein